MRSSPAGEMLPGPVVTLEAGGHAPAAEDARIDRWWVGLCVVLALALRLFRLDYQSLWFDEVLTYVSSATSLANIWSRPPVDPNVPPLYYAIMHPLAALSRGEIVLRLPSVLFGTLAVPLFYTVTRVWMGGKAARIAALLLALSPLHVWYSQEARPYALLLTLALLTICLAQRLLASPENRWLAAGLVLSGSATLYCHPIALPFMGTIALYVWMEAPRSQRTLWLAVAGAICLVCTPAVIRLFLLPPTVSANRFQVFQPAHLGYLMWAFATGYSFGPTLLELRTEAMDAVRRNVHLIGPIVALTGVLLVLGARAAWARGPSVFWGAVTWLAFPVLFVALGTMLTPHPFNVRYALLALPGFILLLAGGIAAIPWPWVRAAAASVVLGISMASLAGYYGDARYHREDVRGAVRYLNNRAGPGDLVIASAAYMTLALEFYQLRNDLELVRYPAAGDLIDAGAQASGPELGAQFVAPPRVAAELDAVVADRGEVWLFLSRTFHSDPAGHIARYMDSRFEREDHYVSAGVTATHYRRRGTLQPARGR